MRSIRTRLSLLVTLAVAISVLTLGIISIYYLRKSSDDYSKELLRLSCAGSEQKIDSYFSSIEQCVDTVAFSVSENLPGLSDEEIGQYLNEARLLFHSAVSNTEGVVSYYYRIDPAISKTQEGFWLTNHGKNDYAEEEMTDISAYDPGDTEHVGWFYGPKNSGRAGWLEPYINKNLDDIKMISYVAPAFWNGKFIGVVGIDYDYEKLTEHLQYNGPYEHGYTLLVDSDGTIIYHPYSLRIQTVREMEKKLPGIEAHNTILSFEADGKEMLASRRDLSNDMTMYLVVPEDDINAPWKRMVSYYVFFALLIMLIFTIIASYVANRITEPLSNLTRAAKKIDEGDYDVELNYEGKDEIGVLSGAFRQLVDHLSSYITDLNDKVYKDALTSVRNKAAFNMYLHQIDDRIAASDEDSRPEFAICMFDCNGLKDINDNYGHDKGDYFIRNSCKLICEVFKHSPVFRLGGDEFVCVLENEDLQNRWALCKEFDEQSVNATNSDIDPWERISIASGIAIYNPEVDKSTRDVFKRADKRMYEDKERKKAGIETVKITEVEY